MKELYTVVRNAISEDALELIKNTILIDKQTKYYERGIDQNNRTAFGDEQSPISYANYSLPINDALALTLHPIMEEVTGLNLLPTYTYSRIYWKGSTLAKHKDRPSCQYSCTINIANDPEPWPIYMEGAEVILNPGDMVVYQGCEAEHWREPYEGNQQIQIFVHYVDADHPYAEWKFDKRPMLGLSSQHKR
jgi:hypothetical protein